LPGESNLTPPPLPPLRQAEYHGLGQRLEKAFAEYNAEIKTGTPVIGPSFLRFPVELGRRVTINAVQRYVQSVQARLELEAPPRVSLEGGRLAVDVQRPDREFVYFSQIRAQLPPVDEMLGNARAPIGVDLSGQLRLADFSQPDNAHLLAAGTPGSGKSEWLRAVVAGLVLSNTPQTLRLALADPKRNAFQQLENSPFLYSPIAYDEQSATALLERLVEEMEARYKEMGKVKADKLDDYVKITGTRMPRVFFVCDEFADLMMGERKKKLALEGMIRRLGQKARAAGIHLILATQQPSRQVTSGPIMAVITAKVALRMDAINSRILLSEAGAESLLGKGDLLYKCIGDPVRLQSPYLPPEELEQVFGGGAVPNS
jgi:DNA segregation ATPase FtsK/SpoIIIE-like protein